MRQIRLLLFTWICCTALSCGDDDDDDIVRPSDSFAGTRWQTTLIDKNPSTNPQRGPGSEADNLYHAWLNCQMDDTFTFANGHFSINDNGSVCDSGEDLIVEQSGQPYHYNEASKQLTIGTGDEAVTFQVYELNKDRLKIGVAVQTGTGFRYMIFIFKKK